MQKDYNHLTLEEREMIGLYKAQGLNPAQIGKKMGRHRSTITRELKRKTAVKFKDFYSVRLSHENVKAQWKEAHKKERIADPEIREYVIHCLIDKRWSPEQISGRMKIELGKSVSHETIYMFIYKEKPELTPYLTRKQPGRKKRKYVRKTKKTNIPNR